MIRLIRLYRLLPKGNNFRLMIIGLLVIAALIVVVPSNISYFGLEREGFRQGLDIKGGTHLVYQSKVAEGETVTDAQVEGVIRIIRRRVDAFGVTEPIVQRVGNDRIMVQIPGIKDVERAKRLIGATAQLEFGEQRIKEDGTPVIDENGSIIWDAALAANAAGQDVSLTGQYLLPNAQVVLDPNTNLPQVSFEFNQEGAKMFESITTRLLNRPLGIILDNQLISSPTVQAVISNRGVITGLTLDDADDLAIELNAGALPIPIELIREQDVDATLGAESVQKSLLAGVIGILLVLGFLLVYYKLPGLLSAGALIIYGLVVLATFKLVPVTLTLSGLAGFILSMGMAVDANVLIFERLKEELRSGRSLKVAIEAGFNRAWIAIRDSNVSTLITCGILWWFGDKLGTPLVTGFAITLAIGVVTSMFSAMFVTRTFLRFFVGPGIEKKPRLFGVSQDSNIGSVVATKTGLMPTISGSFSKRRLNLVDKRRWCFLISAVALLVALVSIVIPPAFNTGIEFSSGSTIEVRFINPTDVAQLRAGDVKIKSVTEELDKLGHTDAIVQALESNTFLIRTKSLGQGEIDQEGNVGLSDSAKIQSAFERRFGVLSVDRFEVDFVSPIVAAEMVRNAALAVFFAIIGIFVYIAWAFRKMPHFFRYSAAAILALAHDVLIVLGLFSIMGKAFGMEMNTMVITAILAVIGYSINNTIVVFDRVRENMLNRTPGNFGEVVNNSLLETIGRSLNTSLTTSFTLLALLLFGGGTLQPFILVLLTGVIAGTYSSMLIGPQLLVIWENGEFRDIVRRIQSKVSGTKRKPSST